LNTIFHIFRYALQKILCSLFLFYSDKSLSLLFLLSHLSSGNLFSSRRQPIQSNPSQHCHAPPSQPSGSQVVSSSTTKPSDSTLPIFSCQNCRTEVKRFVSKSKVNRGRANQNRYWYQICTKIGTATDIGFFASLVV
jgi:hypothetical protein